VSEPLLALDRVHVRYGAAPALRDVSLRVQEGELVGLIGPNGAGKSTTLHAVMGAVALSGGSITFAGRALAGLPPEEVARAGIALVPEGRRVYGGFTVEENLRLGLAARRDGAAEDALAAVYEHFPLLRERRRHDAGVLSGGQQQQLAIARALVAGPRLLLLDEPSLGLAPTMVDTVFAALEEIRERGVTVLLVEQRARRTVGFADRTYVLAGGTVRRTMGPRDAGDTQALMEAYLS
jgi:branched-chain amino acid transport system ATP-binding protein